MLTMRPQFASSMWGITAWQQWNVPVRLMSSVRFHVSTSILRNGENPSIPALLTNTVGAPSRPPLPRDRRLHRAPGRDTSTV